MPSKCKPERAETASDGLTTILAKANKFAGSVSANSMDSGAIPKTNKFAKKRPSADIVPDTPLKVRSSEVEVTMFIHEDIPVGVQITSDSLWILRGGFRGKKIFVRLTNGQELCFEVDDSIDVILLHPGDLSKGNPDSLMSKVPTVDGECDGVPTQSNAISLKILGLPGSGWQWYFRGESTVLDEFAKKFADFLKDNLFPVPNSDNKNVVFRFKVDVVGATINDMDFTTLSDLFEWKEYSNQLKASGPPSNGSSFPKAKVPYVFGSK